LTELQSSFALTYLFITHDLAMAAHLGDEIAVMDRGKVVEQGVLEKVLHAPEHEATRRLLAAVPGSSVTPRLPRAL
jgi:peptide/nickel transport system ATP-binding protein